MTTDIDQKAREIADALEISSQRTFIPTHSLPVISAALQSARNDALDEACVKVYGLCLSDNNAHEIATAIRALKRDK